MGLSAIWKPLFFIVIASLLNTCANDNSEKNNTSNFQLHTAQQVSLGYGRNSKISGTRILTKLETSKLEKELSQLKADKTQIYDKPDFEINIQNGKNSTIISVFKNARFVYKGYYLETWTDRMQDMASKGYGTSTKLITLLESIKSTPEQN